MCLTSSTVAGLCTAVTPPDQRPAARAARAVSPGCADSVDIGESAYTMVLADDLDADGRTDLLLATMNGNMYAFRTAAPAHPLAAWPSEARARSVTC